MLLLPPVVAVGVLLATFEPEAWKPRLAAAVEEATGRPLTLAGPISVEPGLTPAIALERVALANPPGASRPEMLTLRRIELRLALLPLLAGEIRVRRLVLREPDLVLETDAEGRPNWLLTPPMAPDRPSMASVADGPAGAARAAAAWLDLAVDALVVENGRVSWRPAGAEGTAQVLEVPRLEAAAPAEGPVRVEGTLRLAGLPFALRAETGPLADLAGRDRPWPLRISLDAEGLLRLSAEGTLAGRAQPGGWRLRVEAEAAELARLAPLLPDLPLPPLNRVAASGAFAQPEPAAAWPVAFADLRLRAGRSDLGALREGLTLDRLDLAVAAPDQPMRAVAEATLGGLPLRVEGTLGAPDALLRGGAPFPVEIALGAGAATGTVRGAIADPRRMMGVDLAVAGHVSDLRALAPLLGAGGPQAAALPPLRDLALSARLAERGAGFAGGAVLRELRLDSSAGDLAGEVTYATGVRDALAGRLSSREVRLGALLPPPATPGAAAPAPAAPGDAAARQRAIPEIPLPVAALGMFDADLGWTVAALSDARGAVWRQVEAHLALEAGRGRAVLRAGATPATAGLPAGGPLALTLGVDGRWDPPAVTLAAEAPDLDLAGLLAAAGLPPRGAGRLWVEADLRGHGRDTRALAASLQGSLGVAAVQGEMESGLFEPVLAPLRRSGMPLPALPQRIAVPCLALRLVAEEEGMLRSQAMLLETAIGRLGGGGAVNLRDESLALRLLTDIRAAGIALRAPVNVGGTLANPRFGVDPAGAAAGGLEAFLSLQATPDRTLQALAGALGAIGAGPQGPATLPDCASQLAVARGGKPGPQPPAAVRDGAAGAAPRPPAPTPATPPIPGLPGGAPVQDLLRGLLRR
jgi:AsmA protein